LGGELQFGRIAGHRPNVQALDPDSVEAELSGLVHRIAWTEERAATVRMILRQYIELDRRTGRE
jgi:hypothetical protein